MKFVQSRAPVEPERETVGVVDEQDEGAVDEDELELEREVEEARARVDEAPDPRSDYGMVVQLRDFRKLVDKGVQAQLRAMAREHFDNKIMRAGFGKVWLEFEGRDIDEAREIVYGTVEDIEADEGGRAAEYMRDRARGMDVRLKGNRPPDARGLSRRKLLMAGGVVVGILMLFIFGTSFWWNAAPPGLMAEPEPVEGPVVVAVEPVQVEPIPTFTPAPVQVEPVAVEPVATDEPVCFTIRQGETWNVRQAPALDARILGTVRAGRPLCIEDLFFGEPGETWVRIGDGWLHGTAVDE